MRIFADAKRVVVKVGSSTLTHETGRANLRRIGRLVAVLSDMANSGQEVVLVTSGAIAMGVGKLGLASRPADTAGKQAAATVGQCELMFMYDKLFGEYGRTVGQLLITKADVDDDERRHNLVNTFERMFEYGAIPIINENDSVAVEEIVYGDNDSLSATVASLIHADALIILSDVDGLYDANPNENPDARLIPVVEELTDEIYALAGGAGSDRGTGGMATKLYAARIAGDAGIPTVVLNGEEPENIYRLLDGHQTGTVFMPRKGQK